MFRTAESRIEKAVSFFERLHAELDTGIAECLEKRALFAKRIEALKAEIEGHSKLSVAAGEAIGKAVKLKNGLTQLLS